MILSPVVIVVYLAVGYSLADSLTTYSIIAGSLTHKYRDSAIRQINTR